MLSWFILGHIGATVFAFSLYNIYLKEYPKRLVLLFWVEIVTYSCFAFIFFVKKYLFEHDVAALEKLMFDFTYTNAPLYFLMALSFVGSLILLHFLLKDFDISLVTPLSQISLLFTTIGYILLGDPFNPLVLLSVCIIFLGALISSLSKIAWPNPFSEFKNLSIPLISWTVVYALLITTTALITYQVIQITPQTEIIQSWLSNSVKVLHSFPFHFYNPFYFNVGVRFFIMFFFILAFFFFDEHSFKDPFTVIKKDFWLIIKISIIYFISAYCYQYAYAMISDKNILGALNKLAIPTILVLSMYLLGEKPTPPKIIGSLVIVGGGLLVLLI